MKGEVVVKEQGLKRCVPNWRTSLEKPLYVDKKKQEKYVTDYRRGKGSKCH